MTWRALTEAIRGSAQRVIAAPGGLGVSLAFYLVIVGVLALTFVGMAMRGPYWNLYWPWETWPGIPGRI